MTRSRRSSSLDTKFHVYPRREGLLALLAILYIETKRILLYLAMKFALSALSFWYNSTLAIAIEAYAIVVKNQKPFLLLRANATREYYELWSERRSASLSWFIHRIIRKLLDMNSLYVENPLGDTLCGLEHTLVHITTQLLRLLFFALCYSMARFFLQRMIHRLKDSINGRLRISLLALLLVRHFNQPYEVLEHQNSGERAATLSDEAASASVLVTRFIDKVAPPVNSFLIMFYIGFLRTRRRPPPTDSPDYDVHMHDIASTVLNKKVSLLILVALLLIPLRVLLIILSEKQKLHNTAGSRASRNESTSKLYDAMARYRLIKLYDATSSEIEAITRMSRALKEDNTEHTVVESLSRTIKVIITRYTSTVTTLGTAIYLSANFIDYHQAKQIKYVINTIALQAAKLAELPSACIDTYIHVDDIIHELTQAQELGSTFYSSGGFKPTYTYIREHWRKLMGNCSTKRVMTTIWNNTKSLTVVYMLLSKIISRVCHKTPVRTFIFNEETYVEELRTNTCHSLLQDPSVDGSVCPCNPLLIEFRNISFSYNSTTRVLHALHLSITPGQKVAIVGRSGTGKSTISNLIARLYLVDSQASDPTSGIYLNGQHINSFSLSELRNMITILPQDCTLIKGSAVDNILYPRIHRATSSQSEEENISHMKDIIRISYQAACIAGANDFIGKRPYSATLSQLSGGQSQRLGIARVIARGGSVLIFDEATSALDEKTEARIINNMFSAFKNNQTVIFITHRLSTLRQTDYIYVLGSTDDSGSHIVESGTYEWFINESNYIRDMRPELQD